MKNHEDGETSSSSIKLGSRMEQILRSFKPFLLLLPETFQQVRFCSSPQNSSLLRSCRPALSDKVPVFTAHIMASMCKTFKASEIWVLVSICPYMPTRKALCSRAAACSARGTGKGRLGRLCEMSHLGCGGGGAGQTPVGPHLGRARCIQAGFSGPSGRLRSRSCRGST